MTWEWSHTQEAYDYAYRQVEKLKRGILQVIYAEWMTDYSDQWWEERYNQDLARAYHIEPDILVQLIWDRAQQQALCDNGGFNAWVCPFGCHTVPFGPPEEEPQLTDWRDFDER